MILIKRLFLILIVLPIVAFAQHKVSGYATITKNLKESPAAGTKIHLVYADSLKFEYKSELDSFTDKYMEPGTFRGTFTYLPKKGMSKDSINWVTKEYFKLLQKKNFSYLNAINHGSISDKLIDVNGNYEFDSVPDGKFYIILELDPPAFFTHKLILVTGKDIVRNINGTI